MMKPLFLLHKDRLGKVLAAGNAADDYELGTLVRTFDLRDGDTIEVGEVAKRTDQPDTFEAPLTPPTTSAADEPAEVTF